MLSMSPKRVGDEEECDESGTGDGDNCDPAAGTGSFCGPTGTGTGEGCSPTAGTGGCCSPTRTRGLLPRFLRARWTLGHLPIRRFWIHPRHLQLPHCCQQLRPCI